LLGDLVNHAKQSLLTLAAGSSLAAREAIDRQAAALREQLSATAPSPLELLLVDRIVISWIEVYHDDCDLARRLLNELDDHPATKACQARLSKAHARFLSAVKALATVKKLLKPSMSTLDLLRQPPGKAINPALSRARQMPELVGVG
jgi:hypothetical protein